MADITEMPEQIILTLSPLIRQSLKSPSTMECPALALETGGAVPEAVFSGGGRIEVLSSTQMRFTIYGKSPDLAHFMQTLRHARETLRGAHCQLRLTATDGGGRQWSGWALVSELPGSVSESIVWGTLEALLAPVAGSFVAPGAGVELGYDHILPLPLPINRHSTVTVDGKAYGRSMSKGRVTREILNSTIEVTEDPERGATLIRATASEKLFHPYLENWLSEPLRILMGGNVYPRLVARNKGDGTAAVWIRPAPSLRARSKLVSILPAGKERDVETFWGTYDRLLTMIARARDAAGQINFEPHPLTQYFEEVTVASHSSSWVICMTLASAVEGILTLLKPFSPSTADFVESERKELQGYVRKFKGSKVLRKRTLDFLGQIKPDSASSGLRSLVASGVVSAEAAEAFKEVRNPVMHGTLVSPWPPEVLEQRVLGVANLFSALARHYLDLTVPPNPANND